MSRYARQTQLPEVGLEGQSKLAAARVLVVGAGGLAAQVLPLLAGAGIGFIRIVDEDKIALSNLHRQTLFTESDLGASKARVAAKRCTALNSEITVEPIETRLTPANAPDLMTGMDLVVDCADSYAVSYTLSDLCKANKTPLISASVLGFQGYVGGFCGTAPSLRAVFPDAPTQSGTCATLGVMGPAVASLGAMQAQMALTTCLDLNPSPLGQMMQLDLRNFRVSSFRFDGAQEPTQAFQFISASDLSTQDKIVDLRGAGEAPELLHSAAIRLDQTEVATALGAENTDAKTRLALCCASGLRAWRAADDLHSIWPGEIVLVAASAS
ncbi:MAG: HesA/MoeB/ThiF family protein [Pseudomonadota bacterium]